MCTAAVLITPDGGYILANNRDERHTRGPSSPPQTHTCARGSFLAPIDSDAGGTWISVNPSGLSICLLNNYQAQAFSSPQSPIMSRGHVVRKLSLLTSLKDVQDALQDITIIPRANIRPFVVLAIVPNPQGHQPQALRAVWDAKSLHITTWSLPAAEVSNIRYERVHAIRSATVSSLLKEQAALPTPEAIRDVFARHEPRRGASSLCMHSAISRTVSHTQVHVHSGRIAMVYAEGSPCDQPTLHTYTF